MSKPYDWRNIEKSYHHVMEFSGVAGTGTAILTPDIGKKIKILYGQIYLDTNAEVANRYIRLEILDNLGNRLTNPGS